LLNRTTRKVSLTEAGLIFYENCSRIIDDARTAHSQLQNSRDNPRGHLKISAPVMFGDACLNQWIPEFANSYPDVMLDIEVSDRYVDIVAEGFDVVIRSGQLKDADFIARSLMRTRQLTVASPAYLKKHGTPQSPDELVNHILIDFQHSGIANIWTFRDVNGKPLPVAVKPNLRCNSASMEAALASSGFGITRLPQLACEAELADGSLVPILEDFEIPPLPLNIIYPSRKFLAPKVRVFVDFLTEKCAARS
ncbi:MAG: LysR substrate-binding domain-containing protein, partial [Rhizobiaceae bacterium]